MEASATFQGHSKDKIFICSQIRVRQSLQTRHPAPAEVFGRAVVIEEDIVNER